MTTPPESSSSNGVPNGPLAGPWTFAATIRAYFGGLLMGIANLVPGISGGAMLLLVGVYRDFIASLADLASFRWLKPRPWFCVASILLGALTTVLLLAGIVKHLIVTYRADTFSVFIGMRLAAIPIVWKIATPATRSTWVAFACSLCATAALAWFVYRPGGLSGLGFDGPLALFVAGLIAAGATILPGMDGSYILMLLGQYVPILAAVDRLKEALRARDFSAAFDQFGVLLPAGLGVATGLLVVSLGLRWLFDKAPKATTGLLLGVLVGAFAGLWPFGVYAPPEVGSVVEGVVVTLENRESFPVEDWPVKFFTPTGADLARAGALVLSGVAAAWIIARLEALGTKGK